MGEDTVIYLQCPHCKKGWFGRFLSTKDHWTENGKHIMDEFMIEGINPTNLTESIHCLNCHKDYTPLQKELKWLGEGKEIIQFKDCVLTKMPKWVAERVTTCRGH